MKYTKKISKKIWRNLIYVWLTYYLFFYYFKWKTIHKICNENKKLFLMFMIQTLLVKTLIH